jgi:membrane fusion protein (multidrug efflux system)
MLRTTNLRWGFVCGAISATTSPHKPGRPYTATEKNCILAAVALTLIAAGCKKAAPPVAPPPSVEVTEVTATNAPAGTEIIGQLDSPQNVDIRARVEAFVDKMLFTEGTEIKEGDPLFKLDDKPFQEHLAAAK